MRATPKRSVRGEPALAVGSKVVRQAPLLHDQLQDLTSRLDRVGRKTKRAVDDRRRSGRLCLTVGQSVMDDVGTVPGMARQRRKSRTAAEHPPPEGLRQVSDSQLAVYRFQTEAYRNLRHSIAAGVIIIGLFVGSDALFGKVSGAELWSRTVLLLAAVLGAGYFAAASRPRLALLLLLTAVLAAVIGFGLLIAVRYGAG